MVTDVIGHFSTNRELVPDYFDCLVSILKVASGPPKLAKCSDILRFKEGLSAYLTMYGREKIFKRL